jgi:excinuclease ABC subunit C
MLNPETISSFPTAPGVYIMKNAAGDVLYVGKAANLRNRVRNYFSATGDNRFTVQFLVRNVETIETVSTSTEKDAFLLENNLIKKYRPRYNIRLRDDKTYLSLRFRMNHPYPRLEMTRVRRAELGSAGSQAMGTGEALDVVQEAKTKRTRRDNDLYFGPFTSSGAVRETLRFLLKVFPVRTCRDSVFRNRTRPCILFDVGKCCGPCTEPVSQDYYSDLVQRVATFFGGKDADVRQTLEQRMDELSDNLEFEKAAMVRDRLNALERTLENQQAESHLGGDRDVLAIGSSQGRSLVVLQQFRRGVLIHSVDFYTKNYEQENSEVLYSFISQHYDGLAGQIPPEILVTEEPADCALLEEWLREQRDGAVRLHVPQRGKLNAIAHTARQNAKMSLNRRLGGERTREETLNELSERLMLDHVPKTIECLDISNIMGVLAVG